MIGRSRSLEFGVSTTHGSTFVYGDVLLESGSEDEETKNNLGALSGALVESFKRQIPAGAPTAAAVESKMNTEAQPSASD